MRPWRSRQRVSHIIYRSWVRASQVAVQEKLFPLLSSNFELSVNKTKITSKIYNQQTHSEPNLLLLVQLKINPLKISDFTAVAQKEGNKCKRDVHMKTVHLIFFISFWRKKTKFLCDHRNNGNTHKTCQRTNKKCMRPWRSRQRVSHIIYRSWVRASQVAVQEKLFPLLSSNFELSVNKTKITSKIYNQQTHSEPNLLLLVQLKINPLKISDFTAVAQKEGNKCKRDVHMKTVHLIFFISFWRKKTKFLCDHRNNGNTHKTCRRTNKECTRPWPSRQSVNLIILRLWDWASLFAV